jgi:xylan 1,4-beta-xylosidase
MKRPSLCPILFLLPVLLTLPLHAATGKPEDHPEASRANTATISPTVTIHIDASARGKMLPPVWRFFGADEPNYATMKNGRKLINELGALAPKNVYFRTHNLLTSGDGTPALKWGSTGAYDEKDDGSPVYNWTILDGIFETYLQNGVRPYVEIGFMPKALSTHPEPYQHHWTPTSRYDEIYTGWAYPPKDYSKWEELVFQWTRHCVEKYGRAEVESWYWEVWNEPNIGYWRGKPDEFLKLHDYAIHGVKRALPAAKVGGADTAGSGGNFTRQFLEHCLRGTNFASGQVGTPLDFISFHAKGAPSSTNGHVRMGIAAELRTVQDGFRLISAFPELKNKPIVIGECDPEGCAACQGASLAYRNGTMYSSYTAACYARIYDLAEKHGVNLDGALTWAFEFENQPYFAGFRSLASNGLDKPVLNVFRLFARMNGQRLTVNSDGAGPLDDIIRGGVRLRPDISALATMRDNTLSVLVWNYHDDDLARPPADVTLLLNNLPANSGRLHIRQFRIDENHSNAFAAWKRMGSPPQPTPDQYNQLEKAGQLAEVQPPTITKIEDGAARLQLTLPAQAVAFFEINDR